MLEAHSLGQSRRAGVGGFIIYEGERMSVCDSMHACMVEGRVYVRTKKMGHAAHSRIKKRVSLLSSRRPIGPVERRIFGTLISSSGGHVYVPTVMGSRRFHNVDGT